MQTDRAALSFRFRVLLERMPRAEACWDQRCRRCCFTRGCEITRAPRRSVRRGPTRRSWAGSRRFHADAPMPLGDPESCGDLCLGQPRLLCVLHGCEFGLVARMADVLDSAQGGGYLCCPALWARPGRTRRSWPL